MREAFEAGLVDLDPDDRDLAGQLGELRFEYDDRGRIVMESKSRMLSRGVPSPDAADAVSMSFAIGAWRPDPRVSMSEEDRRRESVRELVARVDAAFARSAREAPFETWAAGKGWNPAAPGGRDRGMRGPW